MPTPPIHCSHALTKIIVFGSSSVVNIDNPVVVIPETLSNNESHGSNPFTIITRVLANAGNKKDITAIYRESAYDISSRTLFLQRRKPSNAIINAVIR